MWSNSNLNVNPKSNKNEKLMPARNWELKYSHFPNIEHLHFLLGWQA
jgi:hypothetical protein